MFFFFNAFWGVTHKETKVMLQLRMNNKVAQTYGLAYSVRLVLKTSNYFYRRFFCKINPSLCKTGVYHRVPLSNHVPNNIVIRISIWGRLTFGCIFVSACTCPHAVFIAWQKEYMQVIWIEEKCLEDEVGLQPVWRLVYWMGERREIKMDGSIFNFSSQNIEQTECKAVKHIHHPLLYTSSVLVSF